MASLQETLEDVRRNGDYVTSECMPEPDEPQHRGRIRLQNGEHDQEHLYFADVVVQNAAGEEIRLKRVEIAKLVTLCNNAINRLDDGRKLNEGE